MALSEELVEEVLLRFSPGDPASLVCAALVCKPWCRLVCGPRFRRRFRELHRAAPMLGFFCNVLDARFFPDSSFRPPQGCLLDYRAIDARHGRVLLQSWADKDDELVVWDPTTDERWELPHPHPDDFSETMDWNAVVLCAATASGACDHLDCHGRPFIVVFVVTDHHAIRVYSSEAGSWSERTQMRECSIDMAPAALVGNTLLLCGWGLWTLMYDLSTLDTSVIDHATVLPRS